MLKDICTIISENISLLDKLIDKVSDGIGWIATHDTPNRIAVKTYIEEIEKSNLPPLEKAACISQAKKTLKEYINQQEVLIKCGSLLKENAKPECIDNDWIAVFFDKVRLISDDDVQRIWSRLLAEECNKPGSIPKGMMFVLEKMGREDAEYFTKLCSITVSVFKESAPLVLSFENRILDSLGLNYDALMQLEVLGLIKISEGLFGSSFALTRSEFDVDNQQVSYFGNRYELPKDMTSFPIGCVLYTKDGNALYKIVEPYEVKGFWDNSVVPLIDNNIKLNQK